tara:strand:+ start:304 stop:495 length:192 start_codon:yes stop_codon:yes gene_type:complete
MSFEKIVIVLSFVFLAAVGIGWVKNVVKLADCDFEAPYTAEVIHGVGLIPVIGMFTGWMDFGE